MHFLFFYSTGLLARPSGAACLETDIWGCGVNSPCLQELQLGVLAWNSVSATTLKDCLKIKKNEVLQVGVLSRFIYFNVE